MENETLKDYQEMVEKILESIDTIAKNRIDKISFDKTIVCSIKETPKEGEEIYTVSDGETSYKAVAVGDEKYYVGTYVYVLVPGGNFDLTPLTILRKYVKDNLDYNRYISPLDTFATLGEYRIDGSYSILANSKQIKGSQDLVLIKTITDPDFIAELNESDSFGVRANFRSWLSDYTSGSYGLYAIVKHGDKETKFLFDSNDDMFGDVYNFPIYMPQEICWNKKDITDIKSIDLYLYENGKFGPFNEADVAFMPSFDNIFVEDISLVCGYSLSKYDTDTILLYTTGPKNYTMKSEDLIRSIGLNWIVKDINGSFVVVKDGSEAYDDLVKNARFHWYIYDENQTNEDPITNLVFWREIFNKAEDLDEYGNLKKPRQYKITQSLLPTEKETLFMAAITTITEVDESTKKEKEELLLKSNPLVFTNSTDVEVEKAKHLLDGLTLTCDRNGDFRIYKDSGVLTSSSFANQTFYIYAHYKDLIKGSYGVPEAITKENFIPLFPEPSKSMMIIDWDNADFDDAPADQQLGEEQDRVLKIPFSVKKYYNKSLTDNTVKLTFKDDYDLDLEAPSVSLMFGTHGLAGTDYEFNVWVDTVRPGQPADIIYEIRDNKDNVLNITPSWSWYNEGNDGLKIDNGKIQWINEKPISDCQYYILQGSVQIADVSIGGSSQTLTVTKCFPISVAVEDKYELIGPSTIIYRNDGTSPEYVKDAYELIGGDSIKIYIDGQEQDGNKFYPSLSNKNTLVLPSIYLQDNSKNVCVNMYSDSKLVFTQSLYITKNAWQSNLLNSWDGNLQIDEHGNTILSAMFGAGKKGADNKFSGVLMGDISKADDTTRYTGLYGYQNGINTFGFNIDGTAFLGTSNSGQILIDGNKGEIKSGNFNGDGTASKVGTDGTYLNLKDGLLITNNGHFRGSLTIGSSNGLVLEKNGKDLNNNSYLNDLLSSEVAGWHIWSDEQTNAKYGLVHISNNVITHYMGSGLDSNTYKVNNKTDGSKLWTLYMNGNFGVSTDGKMFAHGADISGTISADNGSIGGWTISSSGISKGKITLGSSGTISSDNFKINADGSVSVSGRITATSGKIGNFNIGSCIYSGDDSLEAGDVYIGTDGIGLGEGAIQLTSDGSVKINSVAGNTFGPMKIVKGLSPDIPLALEIDFGGSQKLYLAPTGIYFDTPSGWQGDFVGISYNRQGRYMYVGTGSDHSTYNR